MDKKQLIAKLKSILPGKGLVFSQQEKYKEILCKPKILPLKSLVL